MHLRRPALALSALLAATGTLTACGSTRAGGAAPATLSVVASFYPIEFAIEQVGGSHVTVTSLTKPGAEPHDIELSPKDVAGVSDARLVVYAKGFQPAVDTAVDQEAADHAFDIAPLAHLDRAAPVEQGESPAQGVKDPHFWLDPRRYADVATAIGDRLAGADPSHATEYHTNAKVFVDKLTALDADFAAGTKTCQNRELVTSHAAFGYLSERYGFSQVSISGLSPDAEPSASKLAEVATFVKEHHVTTIYAETLVEPAFADTVARNTGARVVTLDPVEGLSEKSAGKDYLEVMRSDLAALEAGQGCS